MNRILVKTVVSLLALMALGLAYLVYDVSHRPPRVADMIAAAKKPPDKPTFPVVVAARPIRAGDRIEASALTVEQWLATAAGAHQLRGPAGQDRPARHRRGRARDRRATGATACRPISAG